MPVDAINIAIVNRNIAARNDCRSSFKTPNNKFITLKYLLNFNKRSILRALKIRRSTSNIIPIKPDKTASRSIIAGQVHMYLILTKNLVVFFDLFSFSIETQTLSKYSTRKMNVETRSKIKNSNLYTEYMLSTVSSSTAVMLRIIRDIKKISVYTLALSFSFPFSRISQSLFLVLIKFIFNFLD